VDEIKEMCTFFAGRILSARAVPNSSGKTDRSRQAQQKCRTRSTARATTCAACPVQIDSLIQAQGRRTLLIVFLTPETLPAQYGCNAGQKQRKCRVLAVNERRIVRFEML